MLEGVIAFTKPSRGFGFICASDQENKRIFFHYSRTHCLDSELVEGARVSYVLEETDRGLQAVEVQIIKEEEVDGR